MKRRATCLFIPEGPAELSICWLMDLISALPIWLKTTEWGLIAGDWSLIASGDAGVPGGCLSTRWSFTVLPSGKHRYTHACAMQSRLCGACTLRLAPTMCAVVLFRQYMPLLGYTGHIYDTIVVNLIEVTFSYASWVVLSVYVVCGYLHALKDAVLLPSHMSAKVYQLKLTYCF